MKASLTLAIISTRRFLEAAVAGLDLEPSAVKAVADNFSIKICSEFMDPRDDGEVRRLACGGTIPFSSRMSAIGWAWEDTFRRLDGECRRVILALEQCGAIALEIDGPIEIWRIHFTPRVARAVANASLVRKTFTQRTRVLWTRKDAIHRAKGTGRYRTLQSV